MRKTYSIRTVLMTLMIGEVVIAISLTAWLWYGNGQAAVKKLSADRCSEISSRVEERILSLIIAAQNAAQAQKQLFETGLVNPGNQQQIDQLIQFQLKQLKKNPFLSNIAVGMPDGTLVGAKRTLDGQLKVLRSYPGQDVLEESSTQDASTKRIPGFKMVERPWYREALAKGGPGWTGIYQFPGNPPQLGTSAYQIIEDEERNLLGVSLCDITLGPIDRFLRSLTLTENGRSFVIDASGVLIATSRGKSLIEQQDGSLERVAAIECDDPIIRNTMEIIFKQMGSLDSWPASGTRELTTDRGQVQLAWNPVKGSADINLISLIAIPTYDLIHEVTDRTQFSALIFLILIIVTLPVVWRTAAGITRPVTELNKGMKQIARFEIESKPGKPSRLTELHEMQERMEKMRHALASFEKYVPTRVVRSLLATDQVAKPGMEEATACVYFSDIVGFTSITEQLPTEDLVQVGSEYLESMTREIHLQDGLLDKFIGDAVMAFWIAEVDGTRVTHRACKAALESQRRLQQLRQDWSGRSLPELRARIGLHTGAVLVGNMGSQNRLNYTVLGDTVNLASRLEGLNRVYGTEIIVSSDIAEIVAEEMHCRILDAVAVKGRRQGGNIFELVCEMDRVTEEQLEIARDHREALQQYQIGEFGMAADAFQILNRKFPQDTPSKVMADRCENLRENPPENWTGIMSIDRNIPDPS